MKNKEKNAEQIPNSMQNRKEGTKIEMEKEYLESQKKIEKPNLRGRNKKDRG